MSVVIDAGTASANAGTRGMLNAPDASTTVRQSHTPWSVVTRYPPSVRRTDVTVVPVCTGASISFA